MEAEEEGRIGMLVTVGVVLLALLTVGVVVFTRADATGEAEELARETVSPTADEPARLVEVWRSTTPGGAVGDRGVDRLWTHDSVVTRVSADAVAGYDTIDGSRRWLAETPEGAASPCAAGANVNSRGAGAVLYRRGTAGPCTVLAVYDTRDGELLWSRELDAEAEADARDEATVTTGEETVTVNLDEAGSVDGFHRFDAASGEELPLPEPSEPPDECAEPWRTTAVRHAGTRIAVLSHCRPEPAAVVSVYDADSGELEWTHVADEPGFSFSGMLAGDPVLLIEGEQLAAYSETGDELWRLPVGTGAGELEPRRSAVVGEVLFSQFYPSGAAEDDAGQPVVFAGFDLTAGTRLWTHELPPGTALFGVDSNDMPLLGYPASGGRWQLVWLDPADGTEYPVGALDRRGPTVMGQDEHQLYVMQPVPTDEGPRTRLRAFER